MTTSSSSRSGWAQRLEAVLDDRTALDAFREYLTQPTDKDALDLYFALRAFRGLVENRNADALPLAKGIVGRFIASAPSWLPLAVRQETESRVRGVSTYPAIDTFDAIVPNLLSRLRSLHATFVLSDEFADLLNGEGGDSSRSTRSSRLGKSARKSAATQQLGPTHNYLLRAPHVSQAVTSEDASSSCYSGTGGASGSSAKQPAKITAYQPPPPPQQKSVKTSHNRHRRSHHHPPRPPLVINEVSALQHVPRVDDFRKSGDDAQHQQPQHHTPEGRMHFVRVLTEKLQAVAESRRHQEDANARKLEQLRAVGNVTAIAASRDEAAADEVVEKYLARMQVVDSCTGSPPVALSSQPSHLLPSSGFATQPWLYPSTSCAEFAAAPSFPASSHLDRSWHAEGTAAAAAIYDEGLGSSLVNCSLTSSSARTSTAGRRAPPPPPLPPQSRHHHHNPMRVSFLRSDGIPVVAYVPPQPLYLTAFCRLFSLDPLTKLVFKQPSADGSARFEWIIPSPDAPLPTIDGIISATLLA